MKNYPVLPSFIRNERECANRECKIKFTPKNAKAKFHCLACKNRENFLRLQEKFCDEYKWFKAFLFNVNIVEKLVELGYEFVTDEILKSHKFLMKVGMLPVTLENIGTTAVLYGRYYLIKITEGRYQIIKNDKDASNRT